MSAPTLSGRTRLVGILGWPVSHSRSPAMHNAAFAAIGLDWAYVPLPCAPERLAEALAGLAALGFAGANVTVPHKEAVLSLVDRLGADARRIGAVNTITVAEDRSLEGSNTDASGLRRHLDAENVDVTDANVLLLGAGGAARAGVVALENAATVTVCNRSHARAGALVSELSGVVNTELRTLDWAERESRLEAFDVVMNATTVGMSSDATPLPDVRRLRGDSVVYDMVYAPRPTQLLRDAAAGGATAIDGLGMLLHQGAAAFERWTGHAAPLAVMRDALVG